MLDRIPYLPSSPCRLSRSRLCLWDAGSADAMDITHALLASGLEGSGVTSKGAENLGVKWEGKANKGWDTKSRCLVLRLPAPVTSLVWHHKGDYLGTVMPSAASKAVMIHQVSKGKTQCPFRKTHGQVRDTCLAAAVATGSLTLPFFSFWGRACVCRCKS